MPRSTIERVVAFAVLPLIPVVLGLALFSSTGRDDAHITLWPARMLVEQGEILNYNGDRVEQSSTLLFVLTIAAVYGITGANVATIAYVLAIVFGALTVSATYYLARKIGSSRMALFAALLTATSPYLVYWSFGKMEATFTSLLILLMVIVYAQLLVDRDALSLRRLAPAAPVTLAFVLVRPEMPIVLLCAVVGLSGLGLMKSRFGHISGSHKADIRKRYAVLWMLAVLVVLCVFAFRLWYFNRLFPQPVFAKAGGFSVNNIVIGLAYLLWITTFEGGGLGMRIVVAVSLSAWLIVFWFWSLKSRQWAWHLATALVFFGVYLAYIVFSGGDWMEAGRFFVPIVPLAALGLTWLALEWIPFHRFSQLVLLVLVIVQCQALISLSHSGSTGMPVESALSYFRHFGAEIGAEDYTWAERTNRINIRDMPAAYYMNRLVEQVKDIKSDPIVILSWQQGFVTYTTASNYFRDVVFIDRAGLVEQSLSDCVIFSNAPRTMAGLDIGYDMIFENLYRLEEQCNMLRPDIVFDLALSDDAQVLANLGAYGYTPVFQQIGNVPVVAEGNFALVPAHEYISVRDDLLAQFDEPMSVMIDFADLVPGS